MEGKYYAPATLNPITHVNVQADRRRSTSGEFAIYFHVRDLHQCAVEDRAASRDVARERTRERCRRHGSRLGGLRVPNTFAALSELVRHGILAAPEYYTLYLGYEFLRLLENRLRIASSYGTAAVARTPQDLGRISRLLDYSNAKDPQGAPNFEAAYVEITGSVREVFQRIVSELMK